VRRLSVIATSVVVLLALFAPVALAAGPVTSTGSVLVSVNGTLDVPAGSSVDTVVVVDGTATIAGTVDTVVVFDGTATFTGATVNDLVVVGGRADLQAGTTVGDVSTMRSQVVRDATATISGRSTALEANLVPFAIALVPLLIAFAIGLALFAFVAALVVAAFASRQVREAEAQITERPGHALVAGLAGSFALPIVGLLLVVSVVGAPVGLALLLGVLPVAAFLAWIVAAIWIGDWLVARGSGRPEPGRPYRAALIGVLVLSVASIIPFVSGIATLFGLGALLLVAWRVLRPEQPAQPVQPMVGPIAPMPSAG
jgi:hypothetical protein